MDVFDLRKKYNNETDEKVYSAENGFFPNGSFKDKYVHWLEKQILIKA